MDEGSSLEDTVLNLADDESSGSPEVVRRISEKEDEHGTAEEVRPARKLSLLSYIPAPSQRSLAVSVSPDKEVVLFSQRRREKPSDKTAFSLRREAMKNPTTEKEDVPAQTLQFVASVGFGGRGK